ncbi:hypothetical protein [Alkanindiges illinoisensis]|uniref:hypothetical protein n=1 Tax=Alkanindiges illinoisensis TaxID=197183 RepID=UPI000479EEFF|nr:hypothetical protein [Alkanindiges illinoisensis]
MAGATAAVELIEFDCSAFGPEQVTVTLPIVNINPYDNVSDDCTITVGGVELVMDISTALEMTYRLCDALEIEYLEPKE